MEGSCDAVHATEAQHYTGGQVLDARKTAALVGTHVVVGRRKPRFKGAADYLTHKKGYLLAIAVGARRPAAQCAALDDLARFLGTG